MGILICGLNGAGKSTLGKALADEIQYRFIDIEDLYFYKTNPEYDYDTHRSIDEVTELLNEQIDSGGNFVFTAVKGDYGEKLISNLEYVILLETPKNVRLERLKKRTFDRFGDRIIPGGDLYERENAFLIKVENRPEDYVTDWLKNINCPVIRADGTKTVEHNVKYIASFIKDELSV
ncbi:MAG: AAA family ATPase [Acutalibacteraceae bacterium]